jgi:type IV pilus assembly protein PilB
MAGPNDKNDKTPPKKPATNPTGTAAGGQGGKPVVGSNGSAGPGQPNKSVPPTSANAPKPGAPTPKPNPAASGGKPASPGGSKPAPTPPKKAPPKNKHAHIDANTRQLGQKFVDLGFMDEAQLESIYEDMRTSDARLGDLALERGLVKEEQLLQATAEVHGMRVANLEEVKPNPDAVKLVTRQMAELYKLVPLTYENDILTIAMSDPNNLQAMDDLKNLLGIRNVQPVLAPPKQIETLLAKAY